ncbi:MAG: hypothetical protein MJY53_04220 [Bacteroidales bacterium]|nr:hypothetical protein [Bacteroidales bacterium]
MLEGIKENFARIVALYEEQKQRADSLEGLLSQKEESLKTCKEQIAELNQQIDSLKLSSVFTSNQGGDNTVAKERIDKLIREIDKCISLLED